MFEFTLKSTKDVKRINIEFGDETSEVVVNDPPLSIPNPVVPAVEPVEAPEEPPETKAPPRQRAPKASGAYDPFARAATKTNYGVTAKPKAVAVEPEPVEELDERPDKVDLDFGNSSF